MLNIGDMALAFTIPTDTGEFSLVEHSGKDIVIFFSRKQIHLDAQKLTGPFRVCPQNLKRPMPLLSASQKIRPRNRLNSEKSIS